MAGRLRALLVAGLVGVGCGIQGAEEAPENSLPAVRKIQPARTLGDCRFHHAATVTHVLPLPDGKRLLTSARDGSARLWDLATGKELRRYCDLQGEDIWNVSLSPDTRRIFTSGDSGKVIEWDLESAARVRVFDQGRTVFRSAVSPDGKILASVDTDGACVLWDLADGKKLRQMKPSTHDLYTVAFSPDGKEVLAGGSGDLLHRWTVVDGAPQGSQDHGQGEIYTIGASPDGRWLLSCTEKKGLQVVAADGGLRWSCRVGADNTARCAAWSPDGSRLAALPDENKLLVIDAQAGAENRSIPLPGSTHYGVAFSVDGKSILCGVQSMLYRFDAANGKQLFPVQQWSRMHSMGSVAVDEEGKRIFECARKGGVRVLDLASGNQQDMWLTNMTARMAVYSADTAQLLVAGGEGRLWQVDGGTGKMIRVMQHDDRIVRMQLLSDPARVVAQDNGDCIKVWQLSDGSCLRTMRREDADLDAFAVSPNGRTLVAASGEHGLLFWDLETGKAMDSVAAGEDISSCAFNPVDGRSLMIASGEEILYWPADVQPAAALSRKRILSLVEQLGAPRYQARREATQKLSGGGDGVLRVLQDMESDDPEVAIRLEQVREAIVKQGGMNKAPECIEAGRAVQAVRFHPQGNRWAALVGSDAQAEIFLGVITDGVPAVTGRVCDGHSPWGLQFLGDGVDLMTLNRDGTLSFFKTRALFGE